MKHWVVLALLSVALALPACQFTLYSSEHEDKPRKILSLGANDTLCFAGLNVLGIMTLGAFAWGELECGLTPEAGAKPPQEAMELTKPPPPSEPLSWGGYIYPNDITVVPGDITYDFNGDSPELEVPDE